MGVPSSIFGLLCIISTQVSCYHVAQLERVVHAGGDTDAPALYRERCSHCHGASGRGDGPMGRSLDPPSRDFAIPAWQATTSDDRIRLVIRKGGEALGLSSRMPAHPDLSERDLDDLVSFIREVGGEAPAMRGAP